MDTFCIKRSCCFGIIDLRTASLVIAYTYLVADLVMSTVIISNEAFVYEAKKALDESQHYLLPEVRNTEGIMLALWFLMLPFITALLVGLHKNQAFFVKTYLLAVFTYIMLEITMFFVCLFYDTSALILTVRCLVIIIEVYFLLIVRSHYYEMIQAN